MSTHYVVVGLLVNVSACENYQQVASICADVHPRFHWPLVASLLLASAAAGDLIEEHEVAYGTRWYWSSGLGSVILFLGLIDAMHRDLAPRFATKIPRVSIPLLLVILYANNAPSSCAK